MPNTVGILSPGDMGHTVGGVLRQNGLRVIARPYPFNHGACTSKVRSISSG